MTTPRGVYKGFGAIWETINGTIFIYLDPMYIKQIEQSGLYNLLTHTLEHEYTEAKIAMEDSGKPTNPIIGVGSNEFCHEKTIRKMWGETELWYDKQLALEVKYIRAVLGFCT